jgi:hypothetical protein
MREQCFSRVFSADTAEGKLFRKAVAVAKQSGLPPFEITPVAVGGPDVDVNDAEKAYTQLQRLAEQQRARSPDLTSEQAFARVFRDNPALAARAQASGGDDGLSAPARGGTVKMIWQRWIPAACAGRRSRRACLLAPPDPSGHSAASDMTRCTRQDGQWCVRNNPVSGRQGCHPARSAPTCGAAHQHRSRTRRWATRSKQRTTLPGHGGMWPGSFSVCRPLIAIALMFVIVAISGHDLAGLRAVVHTTRFAVV